MEPYKINKLPFNIIIDSNIFKQYLNAVEKYIEYKTLLNKLQINKEFFLDALHFAESLRSSTIEGTRLSIENLYYINYLQETDDIKDIVNLKNTILLGEELLKNNIFSIEIINELHKSLLSSGRGANKKPGQIRTTQNYIGNITGTVSFTPPKSQDVVCALENLFNYMNTNKSDFPFIDVALAHIQFETIHPYLDGNGRLGRVLISLHLSKLTKDEPILFLSEIIEVYKTTYYNTLSKSRNNDYLPFIIFFLQCVEDQSTANIYKMKEMEKVYIKDKEYLMKTYSSKRILEIHNYAIKKIVFTIKDLMTDLNLQRSTINNVLEKLVEESILIKEHKVKKITYKYTSIYNIFVSV